MAWYRTAGFLAQTSFQFHQPEIAFFFFCLKHTKHFGFNHCAVESHINLSSMNMKYLSQAPCRCHTLIEGSLKLGISCWQTNIVQELPILCSDLSDRE